MENLHWVGTIFKPINNYPSSFTEHGVVHTGVGLGIPIKEIESGRKDLEPSCNWQEEFRDIQEPTNGVNKK